MENDFIEKQKERIKQLLEVRIAVVIVKNIIRDNLGEVFNPGMFAGRNYAPAKAYYDMEMNNLWLTSRGFEKFKIDFSAWAGKEIGPENMGFIDGDIAIIDKQIKACQEDVERATEYADENQKVAEAIREYQEKVPVDFCKWKFVEVIKPRV